MLRQWLRAAGERVGIRVWFTGVICVNGTQSVSIDSRGIAQITTRRSLVFLEPPIEGDLRDTYAIGTGGAVIDTSPDAIELSREETEPGRLAVSWLPREPVTRYALYEHQNGWSPAAAFDASTVCVEYECDMRTGSFSIELVGPTPFDTAVLFKRPHWPHRLSERHFVRAALKRLKARDSLPRITDDGTRIRGEVRGPRVGERYLMVAFRRGGVADCEEWLQQTSLIGRVERVLSSWTHALGN
jgi:hypothetical protein